MFSNHLGNSKNAKYLKNLFSEGYLKHNNLSDATRFIANELFKEYKVTNAHTLVGDKTSAHSQSIQGNDINFTDSDVFCRTNRLMNSFLTLLLG